MISIYVFLGIGYFLIISALTVFVYSADKRASRIGGRRIPEKKLHLLSILGGTLAAYYAQRRYRHKINKISFQIYFWLIAFLQIAVVIFVSKGVML